MATIKASREEPTPVNSLEEEQEPAQTERQVFCREGTVIIRWLFGYYDERNLPGWTNPPRWPHTLSTCLPKKPRPRFKDVTFVGIDIDDLQEENDILRLAKKSPRGNIIQSHHWIIEDPNYLSKNDNRFCFGKHRCVPLSDFKQSLEGQLEQFHPLILVCHGISRERITLRKLDIDLKPLFEIDTTKAARYPLRELRDSTLKKLMKDFKIPCSPELLHSAGNDAHLVLRVLLMIAAHDARKELKDVPVWVPVFEAVTRAPLPPMPLKRAQKAAIKRREKRDPVQLAAAQVRWANVLRSRQEASQAGSELANQMETLSVRDTE